MTLRQKRLTVCICSALVLLVAVPLAIDLVKPARNITIIVDGDPSQTLNTRFVAGDSSTAGIDTLPFRVLPQLELEFARH